MDCNKDEATRAKELAEKKFIEKDVDGAKKLALKAQKLYPDLDGLCQLLATLDVHISAGKKVSGVVDYYRVLGAEPLADDDTIRKHYRKLALMLHPDKNKSVGAEGAFKILSEAWSLLSDKNKRLAYDKKRFGRHGEIPNVKYSPVIPGTGDKCFHDFTNSYSMNTKSQKNPSFAKCPPPHFQPKPNSFWSTCRACNMHYEYLRTYLNNNLICFNCRQPFLAVETTPPPNAYSSSTLRASYMKQQSSGQNTAKGSIHSSVIKPAPTMTVRSGPFSKSGSAHCAATLSSKAAQAAGGVEPSSVKLKRVQEVPVATFLREDAIKINTPDPMKGGYGSSGSYSAGARSVVTDGLKKKKRKDEKMVKREMSNQIFTGKGAAGMSGSENGSSETGRVKLSGKRVPDCNRELSLQKIRSLLIGKAKKEICQKLDEWSRSSVSKTAGESKSSTGKIREEPEERHLVNGMKSKANKCAEFVITKAGLPAKQSSPAYSDVDFANKGDDATSMSVPDPDFHDFDRDRSEISFGENQVWAAYDEDDGMPRYYAMVHNVISLKPFRMRISWLNSKSNNELAPLNWVRSGFPKTCGDFWRGKYEIYNSLNSFSHQVKWAKGTRGAIQIYPRKAEVWALYKNWVPDWNELTPDDVIHKYDMVEVLEDYHEKTGVSIVPLSKVPGFKTVFRQHLDPSKRRTIPREEMFRFSHQVPSYLLTGQEGHNSPKGCLELDPASTPLELLQVLTEAQLKEMETAEMMSEEVKPSGGQENGQEELVKNGKNIKEEVSSGDVRKEVEIEAIVCKRKEMKEEKMAVYKRRRQKKGT